MEMSQYHVIMLWYCNTTQCGIAPRTRPTMTSTRCMDPAIRYSSTRPKWYVRSPTRLHPTDPKPAPPNPTEPTTLIRLTTDEPRDFSTNFGEDPRSPTDFPPGARRFDELPTEEGSTGFRRSSVNSRYCRVNRLNHTESTTPG